MRQLSTTPRVNSLYDKKRVFLPVIALLLVFCLLPVSAFAAEYALSEGSVTVSADSNGQTVTHGSNAAVSTSGAGDVTVLPADSAFTIKGLGHGTYYVQEVSNPRGYFLPAGRFKLDLASFTKVDASAMPMHERLSDIATGFTYTNNADEKLVGGKTADGRTYTVSLRNATLPVLPSTGGVGTAMFTVGGAAVMVLAAVLFLRRKKED